MLDAGGEGALSMEMEMRQWTRFGTEIESKEIALNIAKGLEERFETTITNTDAGKFILWYR